MKHKKNASTESPELPNYLTISTQKEINPTPMISSLVESSKKKFPQLKYGISQDAPLEFHTKHSFVATSTAKSVLMNDPIVKTAATPYTQNKEYMTNWPMKSIRTGNIDNAPVYHKFTTRAIKPKEVYDCILGQQKTVERPDLIIGEESYYTKKFYQAVQEQKAFHKKVGYFENFTNHHKITNQQYKERRSHSNGHTRYISKPVILTTLNTKNNMSGYSTENHSKLLQSIKQQSNPTLLTTLKHETSMDQSHIQDKEILSKIDEDTTKPDNLPQRVERPSLKQGLLTTHKNFYAQQMRKGSVVEQAPQNTTLETTKVAFKLQEIKRNHSVQPLARHESSFNQHSSIKDLTTTRTVDYNIWKPEPNNLSFHTSQRSIRYKTKEITRVISQDLEQAIQIDPSVFIKHEVPVENKRNSDILISVLDRNKNQVKAQKGAPVRYLSTPPQRPVNNNYSMNDNITRFERHINRLKHTSKHFGAQRWFYNKDWKLDKMNLFESQPKHPDEKMSRDL